MREASAPNVDSSRYPMRRQLREATEGIRFSVRSKYEGMEGELRTPLALEVAILWASTRTALGSQNSN